ncbi:DUF2071 domain-containing protein [Verrucomicrobiaceae bacterium R5-34]|nr:DUF2071 domain-containing protein [Verrucomicrobiaceae bacterium R5-34]
MPSSCPPTLEQRLSERGNQPAGVVMRQRWAHLLFLHWEIDADSIQRTLPAGLTVDTHDGSAFLGVVPFFMQRVRPVFCPPLPGLSWFQELNLRTYVYDRQGRPGVWFYSLDCNQWLAVKLARTLFNLPYQHARMSSLKQEGQLKYQSQRHGDEVNQLFQYPAQLTRSAVAEPGSLEFFLLERYRLFSADRTGGLYQGQVSHTPYQYQEVTCSDFSTRLCSLAGFTEPETPPVSSLIAEPVSVNIHPLSRSD